MSDRTLHDPLVWQLADSAFPTGAFAHSLGLEAAWQQGEVVTGDDVRRFTEATILQAGTASLPLVNAAWRQPDRLPEWDALNDAFLSNPVANRASRQQGRTLAASAARIWTSPALEELHRRAASTSNYQSPTSKELPTLKAQSPTPAMYAHVAPITGAVCAALAVPLETTQRLVLYAAARGVLSAAVRLGIIGSYEAQRLQSDAAAAMARVLARCRDADPADLAQTAPLIDIVQGAHDRLYSRLFQS